ncbi:hypothetical protein V4Y04_32355 [Streptomyces sp. P9-A2]
MARRSLSDPGETAYYLVYAPVGIEIADLVRVAGSRWAVQEGFRAAKNECGPDELDEYEVRCYVGRYRHIALAMLAHTVLVALAAQASVETAKKVAETDQPPVPLAVTEIRRLLDALLPHPRADRDPSPMH